VVIKYPQQEGRDSFEIKLRSLNQNAVEMAKINLTVKPLDQKMTPVDWKYMPSLANAFFTIKRNEELSLLNDTNSLYGCKNFLAYHKGLSSLIIEIIVDLQIYMMLQDAKGKK